MRIIHLRNISSFKSSKKFYFLNRGFFILVSIIIFSSCITQSTAIQDIVRQPDSYYGRQVLLQGLVTDTLKLPFRNDGIYRIFDQNKQASIWVYSKALPLPERGLIVQLTGEVRQNHDFRERIVGPIFIEKSRHH